MHQDDVEIPRAGNSIYSVLLRHRRYIFGSAALVAGVFAILTFVFPAKYESVAQLMPPDEGSSSMSGDVGERAASMLGLPPEMLGGQGKSAMFSKVLTSQSAEDAVIARFDLRKVYGVRYWQSARKILEENTKVVLDRKSGVLKISVRDKDRDRAKAMCQTYVDELNRLVNQLSTSSARRQREFLEERLKVIKKELDESAARLGQFSSKNKTVDISQEGRAMVEALATLQGQLVLAEAELDGLKKVYSGDNIRVTAAEARVAELRRNVQMQSGQESNPSVDTGLPYPSIRELPLLGVTYSELLQRTQIDASVYEILTKQLEMARVQEAKDIPTVRPLDPPSFPEERVHGRMFLILCGGVLGLILSSAWIYLKEVHPEVLRTGPAAQIYCALRNDLAAVINLVRRREKR